MSFTQFEERAATTLAYDIPRLKQLAGYVFDNLLESPKLAKMHFEPGEIEIAKNFDSDRTRYFTDQAAVQGYITDLYALDPNKAYLFETNG